MPKRFQMLLAAASRIFSYQVDRAVPIEAIISYLFFSKILNTFVSSDLIDTT